jgi:hypothetical protein
MMERILQGTGEGRQEGRQDRQENERSKEGREKETGLWLGGSPII